MVDFMENRMKVTESGSFGNTPSLGPHQITIPYNSRKSEWDFTRNPALPDQLQCIPCETPSPQERLGRCSVLMRQLALSVIEPLGISCGPCGHAALVKSGSGLDPTFRPFKCFAGSANVC